MQPEETIGQPSAPPARRYSTTEMISSMGQGGKIDENKHRKESSRRQSKIFDDTMVALGYDSVPLLEIDALPRGGISLETKAVGRIQVRLTLLPRNHIQ